MFLHDQFNVLGKNKNKQQEFIYLIYAEIYCAVNKTGQVKFKEDRFRAIVEKCEGAARNE